MKRLNPSQTFQTDNKGILESPPSSQVISKIMKLNKTSMKPLQYWQRVECKINYQKSNRSHLLKGKTLKRREKIKTHS